MAGRPWPHRLFVCPCDRPPAAAILEGPAAWRHAVALIQAALKERGFDPGPVDGVRGPLTDAALRAFKRTRGLRDRAYLGPVTIAALFGVAPLPVATGEPRWLSVARRHVGLREIPGPANEPVIVAFWRTIGATWFRDDETPWCGAFVGAVLAEAGIAGLPAADAPRARAWGGWGRALAGPAVGAVVAMWRGSLTGRNGHVGFVVGQDRAGRLMVLGGNQADAVTIAAFDPVRVLAEGFRWPAAESAPEQVGWATLPVLDA